MTAPAPPGPNVINNHIAKRAPSRHDNTLETVGNLDLRKVAALAGNQNTLSQIRRVGLGHGSPPGPYPSQRAAHPNGFKPRSKAL